MNDSLQPAVRAVILSGGFGTRLWPVSRESHPKQFHALQGAQSLLQETALRFGELTGVKLHPDPLLVCNTEHRFLATEQLRDAGFASPTILLESAPRGTAPALTLACLEAIREAGDAANDLVLLVMPADHSIKNTPAFSTAVSHAAHMAAELDTVITFGIQPHRVETGYGYILKGEACDRGGHMVEAFKEKPEKTIAQAYLESGRYLWNSGMFMVRPHVWLRALGMCQPDMLIACEAAMHGAVRDLDFIRPDGMAFAACPHDSIDYAVMERLPQSPNMGIQVHVVELTAQWSDIGAWDALADLLPKDDRGNATSGDVSLLDCNDSLLFSNGRLVTGIGLQQMVVVETSDAVLVMPRARAQEVRHLVDQLKTDGHNQGGIHRKVHRPWGWYDCLDRGPHFQVKRIVVKPGASLSLQLHHHRAEHWVVVHGVALVTNGEKTYRLNENESTFIPLGHKHRLSNPGDQPLEMIEVQSGTYLGEDDVVRFEDVYGRPSPP